MIIIIILAGENLEFKLMVWVCLSAYTYKVDDPPKWLRGHLKSSATLIHLPCLHFPAADLNFPLCFAFTDTFHTAPSWLICSFTHLTLCENSKSPYCVASFEPSARDTEMRWKACNLAGGENNRSESQRLWMIHMSPTKPCWALWTELTPHEWSCLHWNQRLGWGVGGVLQLTKEPIIVTVTVWLLFYFLSLKSNNLQLEIGEPHMSSETLMKLYQII